MEATVRTNPSLCRSIPKKLMYFAISARAKYELHLMGHRKDKWEKQKLTAEKIDAKLAVEDLVQMK